MQIGLYITKESNVSCEIKRVKKTYLETQTKMRYDLPFYNIYPLTLTYVVLNEIQSHHKAHPMIYADNLNTRHQCNALST